MLFHQLVHFAFANQFMISLKFQFVCVPLGLQVARLITSFRKPVVDVEILMHIQIICEHDVEWLGDTNAANKSFGIILVYGIFFTHPMFVFYHFFTIFADFHNVRELFMKLWENRHNALCTISILREIHTSFLCTLWKSAKMEKKKSWNCCFNFTKWFIFLMRKINWCNRRIKYHDFFQSNHMTMTSYSRLYDWDSGYKIKSFPIQ